MVNKQEFDALTERVANLEKLIKNMDTALKEKNLKIATLENNVTELSGKLIGIERPNVQKELWVNVATKNKPKKSEAQLDIINTMTIEANDRSKRENNVVIFGLPVSSKALVEEKIKEDENMIRTLFNDLSLDKDKICKIHRLKQGINASRPPPVVIHLSTLQDRNNVLKAAKNLKSMNRSVFINPDLTIAERHLANQLRTEAKKRNSERKPDDIKKFYFGIRDNQVKKIDVI